ncbi:MAG: DUF2818 family protein [Burkholderiales bacterium]|nr:DUF2818 family protein [Burkholderiales bacterium]
MSAVVIAYFVLAAVAANMPFVSENILFFLAPAEAGKKHWAWRFLELLLLYGVVILLGRWLESRQAPVHAKAFLNFYVPTFALFLIAGYPGFVIRYFWRKPGL